MVKPKTTDFLKMGALNVPRTIAIEEIFPRIDTDTEEERQQYTRERWLAAT